MRRARRFAGGVVAAVALIAGAPAAAYALDESPAGTEARIRVAVDDDVAEDFAVLLDTYDWHERDDRVEALQDLVGVHVDGWYGPQTRRAHVAALAWLDLPTDGVPPLPGPSAEQWAALRRCESGGDYTVTSRTGKYRGAYQFDRSTWNSVAGRHDPSLVGVDPAAASPDEQDAMALALYSERGARPWPHCGRHLR